MSGASLIPDVLSTGLQFAGENSEDAIRQQQLADNLVAVGQQANDARARGSYAAGQLRSQATQLAARQRVAFANSGVDVTQGTPAQVMSATGTLGELDAQTALNNAAREAWGYDRQGQQIQQAIAMDATASQNKKLGILAAGAGQFGNDYGSAVQMGMGGGGGF